MSKNRGGKCAYVNCDATPRKNEELSFFSFPSKRDKRFIDWIINSGRDEFSGLREEQLRNRLICSRHFESSAFTNTLMNRLLRSHPAAIPIPWFNLEENSPNQNGEEEGQNSNKKTPNSLKTSQQVPQHCKPQEPPHQTHQETLEEFNSDFLPLTDKSNALSTPPINEYTPRNNKLVSTPPNIDLTPRKKKLLSTVCKQKKLLKKRINKISFLRKRNPDKGIENVASTLSSHISGEPLEFIKMQLRHQVKCKWTKSEKSIALSFFYKAPNMYRFLRQRGYKLPCITLIRHWVNINNVTPGFTKEVFDKMKTKAASMSREERQCVLMCDEMCIKKSIDYNSKLDIIEGFEDFGPLGRSEKLATHALVFMLRGLKHPWKLPIAYTLSNNSVKTNTLALLLDICIGKILETSMDLKVLVSDLGSTNAAALKLMGVSKEVPYYVFGERKIVCLFDYPHLLKCVRNNLLKHDISVGNETISWKAIIEFYELDSQSATDCRAAPKLSERHMNPQAFQKMSVKLAAQVFSSSVSRGMKAANHLGLLHNPATASTANFLGRINDLTDCMNSMNNNEKNPFKRPLSTTNITAMNCLKEAISFIESWSINGSRPPCFDGLLQTLQGVTLLLSDVTKEVNSFLLTGRLNQDALENLFGVIRQRSGYNNNPSAAQFRRSLQHCMSIRLMDPPGTANCEPDSDEQLDFDNPETSTPHNPKAYTTLPDSNPTTSDQEVTISHYHSFDSILVHENTSIQVTAELNLLEENVICYIAGWLAKKCVEKFKCSQCSTDLIKPDILFGVSTEQLIFFKAFTRHTGEVASLKKPSESFFNIVKFQTSIFSQYFPKVISSEKLKEKLSGYIGTSTEEMYPQWWTSNCKDHRVYMMKLLVKCKLFYSLKFRRNDLRDSALIRIGLKRKHEDRSKLNEKLKKLQHV